MDALAALRLQLEWGVDEALDEAPVDRLAQRRDRPTRVAPAAMEPARPAPPHSVAAIQPVTHPPVTHPLGTPPPGTPPPARRAREIAEAAASIEALRDAMATFDGCALAATATNLVFADGNPASGLMFVGEGPGAEEDRIGKPFVGPSGQFLDRMLASIGLDREKYLITNLIPWRPPGNRNPTDSEVLICLPFLLRHITLVRPRRLVLLGALATRALVGDNAGIRRLRGRWVPVTIPGLDAPIPALPMLHPAYLLRTRGAKRDAWADMITLRRALDSDT